eukprot:2854618-Prymnesium_polylepis.2
MHMPSVPNRGSTEADDDGGGHEYVETEQRLRDEDACGYIFAEVNSDKLEEELPTLLTGIRGAVKKFPGFIQYDAVVPPASAGSATVKITVMLRFTSAAKRTVRAARLSSASPRCHIICARRP